VVNQAGQTREKGRASLAVLPSRLDDAAIVARLRDGDRLAIAALFDRHADTIERVLHRVLGADAEIPDLLQDVFMHVMVGADRFRGGAASLQPWLVQIAVRSARKCICRRTTRRWLGLTDTAELPDAPGTSDPELQATLARVYRVLDRMPARERIPFALRHLEGMQLPEVAAACGVSLATSKRRLVRARERFDKLAASDAVLRTWLQEGER